MLSNSISSQFSPIISLQVVADIMMDAQGLWGWSYCRQQGVWQNCFTMRLFVIKRSGVSAHLVLAVGRCWVAASNTHGGCKIPRPVLVILSIWIIYSKSEIVSPLSLRPLIRHYDQEIKIQSYQSECDWSRRQPCTKPASNKKDSRVSVSGWRKKMAWDEYNF